VWVGAARRQQAGFLGYAPGWNVRGNNFDLLRFAFAFVVYLSHSGGLTGQPSLAPLGTFTSSRTAVACFFVVSGYLIFMSYERSRSLGEYASKRIRRIYPAYVCVILACAFGCAALSELPLSQYFSRDFWRYLGANLVFLNTAAPELPGVFTHNVYHYVNGALWTLKIEVAFYVAVPVLVWIARRVGKVPTLAGVYVLSVAYFIAIGMLAASRRSATLEQVHRQLPGQLSYFVAGAAGFYYGDQLARARWAIVVPLVAAGYVVASWFSPVLRACLEPAALGVFVTWAATILPKLGDFGRYGDLSYGLYIIHYPIVQALTALGAYAASPWLTFGAATILVLVLAALSWHFIEKPMLHKTSHYVLASADEHPSSRSRAAPVN
jgi:peptidoglycan/LPS O-acetylase OafA/YrhL